eukprot:6195521-Pleurochrysis_carterae.AAC.10
MATESLNLLPHHQHVLYDELQEPMNWHLYTQPADKILLVSLRVSVCRPKLKTQKRTGILTLPPSILSICSIEAWHTKQS